MLSPSYVKPINHAVLPWPLTIGSKPTSVQRLRNLTTPPSTHLVTEVTEAVIDNCDVKNLIKLCQYWRKYEKRTKNFYDSLADLLAADTGHFQRVKNFTGDLMEDDEVINKFISKIYTGCVHIQTKMEKANQMLKAFKTYETKGKMKRQERLYN